MYQNWFGQYNQLKTNDKNNDMPSAKYRRHFLKLSIMFTLFKNDHFEVNWNNQNCRRETNLQMICINDHCACVI